MTIKKVKGGFQVNSEDGASTLYEGVRTKAEVLDQLPVAYTETVVPEPDGYCRQTVKQMLTGIIKAAGADTYQVYLTRGKCFRFGVYSEYKASRVNTPKPYHLPTVEEYLIEHHDAIVCHEIEADDALAIQQTEAAKRGDASIICTIDKDLNMVPGLRYDWGKGETYLISEEDGLRSFWAQMLSGDSDDDIPGITGIGAVKSKRLVQGLDNKQCKQVVTEVYEQNGMLDVFERNAMLLWMLRKPLEQTYNKTYAEFMAGSEQY